MLPSALAKARAGRPQRSPVDSFRAAAWYERVRAVSGWSELQLDAHFGDRDPNGTGGRRLTRWNKYKFGRSVPPRSLLLNVERTFDRTIDTYDHVIWDFLLSDRRSSSELHALIRRLPTSAAELFIEHGVSDAHPFWLKASFAYEGVLTSLTQLLIDGRISSYDALAALLAVADDGLLRQIEIQHVDAHAVIGWLALSVRARAAGAISPDVFIHIFDRWLSTQYTSEDLRDTVNELRPPVQSAVPTDGSGVLFSGRKRDGVQLQRGQYAYRAASRLLMMRTQLEEGR